MAGSKEGAYKARETNKAKHGEDFYSVIGKLGGMKSRTGGFASEKVGPDGLTGKERASKVGVRGGHNSRRKYAKGLDKFKMDYESMENEP